ncbi:MAG: prolipoprotein diacylglyceryl transferase [Pseudomonadota bacterium]
MPGLPYPEIDPVLFQIGPLAIRWYALAYIAGIILGWRYIIRLVRSAKLWGDGAPPASAEQVDDLVAWVTLGIIGGGRLGYVLFYNPSLIWTDPLQIAAVWNGGMSFHGGLIGVTLAGVLFARRNDLEPIRLGDLFAAAAPIGLFFGRLANFINGELYGRAWDGPWSMIFPSDPLQVPRHPSQLYEAALEGLVLFLVLRFASHHRGAFAKPGLMTGVFLAGYGVARTLVETVRQPDIHMPGFPLGLTMGMALSIPMIALGAYIIRRALSSPSEPGRGATGAEGGAKAG